MMGNHNEFSGAAAPAISSSQAKALYATGGHHNRIGLFAKLAAFLRDRSRRYMEAYEYRRTVAALSSLDARTLQDIGIDRSAIRYVAMEAVRNGRKS